MSWQANEYFVFKNVAAAQGPFILRGGNYMLVASGTVTAVALARLAADGTTYVSTPLKLTAAGTISGYVGSGTYEITVTGSAAYLELVSINEARGS